MSRVFSIFNVLNIFKIFEWSNFFRLSGMILLITFDFWLTFLARCLSQLAQFAMAIYVVYAQEFSSSIIVAFAVVSFVFCLIEVAIESIFPLIRRHHSLMQSAFELQTVDCINGICPTNGPHPPHPSKGVRVVVQEINPSAEDAV